MLLLPDLNAVAWSYPFDPAMPDLGACLAGDWVAGILGRDRPLTAEPRGYNPEISALVAYRDQRTRRLTAYGKVAPQATCGLIHLVMDRLWRSQEWRSGPVRVARPLAYRAEVGLLVQSPLPGRPLMGNRNRTRFAALVDVAAVACAALHRQDLPFGAARTLADHMSRLEAGIQDLTYTAPGLVPTLRRLIDQLGRIAARGTPDPSVPSHGDFKYDQFLEHDGRFSLIDLELFCQAEPALDVGTFCAYLIPSAPRDWQDSTAAEVLRARFLEAVLSVPGGARLPRVALFEAAMLGLRGLAQVWSFQSGWERRASGLLDLALDRLADPEPRPEITALAAIRNATDAEMFPSITSQQS